MSKDSHIHTNTQQPIHLQDCLQGFQVKGFFWIMQGTALQTRDCHNMSLSHLPALPKVSHHIPRSTCLPYHNYLSLVLLKGHLLWDSLPATLGFLRPLISVSFLCHVTTEGRVLACPFSNTVTGAKLMLSKYLRRKPRVQQWKHVLEHCCFIFFQVPDPPPCVSK